jgi:hypothetical protein
MNRQDFVLLETRMDASIILIREDILTWRILVQCEAQLQQQTSK